MGWNVSTVGLAVNGTLMRGLALNSNLLHLGSVFVRETKTWPCYRLWSIDDVHPGMMRVTTGGSAIDLEIWAVPTAGLSQLLLQEPTGLCMGRIRLEDGSEVLGVLAESWLCEGQREITSWGGWRTYCNWRDLADRSLSSVS